MSQLFLICLALTLGMILPLQASINASLRSSLDATTTVAALISFMTGTASLLLAVVVQGGAPAALSRLGRPAIWEFLGGPLGAIFLFGLTFLAPRLGLTVLLSLVIAGQLVASMVLDRVGIGSLAAHSLSIGRISGVFLVMIGVLLVNFSRD